MPFLRSALMVMIALLLAVSTPVFRGSPAAAAVRAAAHDDFGRIVFDMPSASGFTTRQDGKTAVITFQSPVEGDPRKAIAPLKKFIASASISPDRKTVTLTLTGNKAINAFSLGSSVVVDVRAGEVPTAAADTGSKDNGSDNRIPVRVGHHDGHERLVFDWPKSVPYKVNTTATQAVITFQRPASIDLDSARATLPAPLKDLSSESGKGSVSVTIPLPDGARIRHFANGAKIAVDVVMSPEQAEKVADQQAEEAPRPPAKIPDIQVPVAGPPAEAPPAPPARPAGKTPAPTREAASPATPAFAAAGSNAARPDPSDIPEEGLNGSSSQTASLSFPWNEPAAAAVFRRAGYYWIVFDRHQNVDLKLQKKLGGNIVRSIEQLPSQMATVVRLVVEPGYNASLRREGLLWIVDFMRQPYRSVHPVEVQPQPKSPVGPRLYLPAADGGKAMVLQDPEVGDRFIVVPVLPTGHGITPARSFPDATLPVTAQGLLIEPGSDRVSVNSTRNGVEVTAQGGMILSSDTGMSQAMSNIGADTNLSRVLDIPQWMHGPIEDFDKNRQALQMAVAQSPSTRRNPARLELARFFFAHGYEAEALGILSVIEADSPDLANSGAVKALRGAAEFMMGRWPEAVQDLSHPSLAGVDEAKFWRALAQAQLGQPELQAPALRDAGGVIGNYPRPVKVPMAILAAEAMAAAGDDMATNTFLQAAHSDDNTAHEKAAMTYIAGKQAETAGKYDDALELWGSLADNTDRYYRAVATRDRLELLYRLQQLDRANLIKGLERLRFAWRGGLFEFSLLMRLGDLYTEEHEYGKALRVWQQAATYFQNQPGAEVAMGRMKETFDKLYYGGMADNMTPLRAIALFDEFRDLTPEGSKGDDMIRRLADRLVSVDLLQQAAALLERQVKYRLSGAEKARVGARLGLVYLLDRRPTEAVEALLQSKAPDVQPPLERQRQLLLARGLADIGRTNDAISLLEGDDSRTADLLRAEIEWKSGNWKSAATALARLVPDAGRVPVLSDDEAQLVLDWATALTLGQDERGVSDVRRRYLSAMERTPFKDAFNLITTSPENGVIDYRTVADRIKQAEDFKSFMSSYRDRLKDSGLSSTIQ